MFGLRSIVWRQNDGDGEIGSLNTISHQVRGDPGQTAEADDRPEAMSVDMLTLRRKNGSCRSQPHAIVFEIDREQSAIPPFGPRDIQKEGKIGI